VWVVDGEQGELAGFCAMALPTRDEDGDEDTAEITAFYVDPSAWRGGIGRALMEAALGDLGGRGFTEVTLWAFDANARARAFYESFGFTADGAARTPSNEPLEIRMRRFV
jgi:ribosomal protein S18 acetylase RimI-like enzyme